MKHQSFVYTQLNNQTVLFQTIQFSIRYLGLRLNVKQFYLNRTLSGATRVDLGAWTMKGYSAFPKAP